MLLSKAISKRLIHIQVMGSTRLTFFQKLDKQIDVIMDPYRMDIEEPMDDLFNTTPGPSNRTFTEIRL